MLPNRILSEFLSATLVILLLLTLLVTQQLHSYMVLVLPTLLLHVEIFQVLLSGHLFRTSVLLVPLLITLIRLYS